MAQETQSVLTLKTRPPAVPARSIPRARLSQQLTAAVAHSMTLVSAGPGMGKTLTVASWNAAEMARSRVAWLSLDESDNDIRAFWSELIVALIASGGVPLESPLRDIAPAAEFGAAEVVEVRSRLAGLPMPIVLILDDFHEITDDAVLASFSALVDHLPPTLRVVLLTRTDPPIRLHRLRLDGELTEIRAADLAFSHDEAAQLFEGAGMALRPDQISILVQRTEGWAAGLRLAAMSLRSADIDREVLRFSGVEHPVAEYLAGEVMAGLPAEDRDFLMRTSVVERISGPLALRLADRSDAQHVLERLVRANAFVVELGGRNEWFSYHRMMREMLQHRLGLEEPALKAQLHAVAAQWLLEHGQHIEAIHQSILAGDWAAAGRTLLSVLPKIVSPEGPSLAAALEPLAMRAAGNPSLSALLAAATYHLHRKQYIAMLQDVEEAQHYVGDAPGDVKASAEVVLAMFEMISARTLGNPARVVDLGNRAIDILDGAKRKQIPAAVGLRIIAESNRSGAQVWTGGTGVAERLEASADRAAELGLGLAQLNMTGHLALLDALHGRCRSAYRRSGAAMELISRHGWGSEAQALAALLSRGLVELTRHRPDDADKQIQRGLAASGRQTDRSLRIGLAIGAVLVAVSRGNATAALAADARVVAGLARTPGAGDSLERWSAVAGAEALLLAGRPHDAQERLGEFRAIGGFAESRERVCLATIQLALGKITTAEELLQPLLRPASPYRESAVAARLLQALVADRKHRDAEASKAVAAAIDLAQPEEIVRPFVTNDPRVGRLLERHQHLDGRHEAFVDRLRQHLDPGREPAPEWFPVETLTERELTVLQYLPTLFKTHEIAVDLNVSVNTVKAHMRSIYSKLGTNTRRDAVTRARSQRLI